MLNRFYFILGQGVAACYEINCTNMLGLACKGAAILETRASARRVINTPGRRHFLIIKYFKVKDNDIRQDIVYNVSL